jgi:hypothetical protein
MSRFQFDLILDKTISFGRIKGVVTGFAIVPFLLLTGIWLARLRKIFRLL